MPNRRDKNRNTSWFFHSIKTLVVGNFPCCTWFYQKMPKRYCFWLFDVSSSLVNFNLDLFCWDHMVVFSDDIVTMNGRPGVTYVGATRPEEDLAREISNQRTPLKIFNWFFLLHLQLLEISMQWLLKDDGHLDFLGKNSEGITLNGFQNFGMLESSKLMAILGGWVIHSWNFHRIRPAMWHLRGVLSQDWLISWTGPRMRVSVVSVWFLVRFQKLPG